MTTKAKEREELANKRGKNDPLSSAPNEPNDQTKKLKLNPIA